MQEAIHKMQDRLFNKGRKYNDIIQVYIEINELCLRTIVQSIFCTLVGQSIIWIYIVYLYLQIYMYK